MALIASNLRSSSQGNHRIARDSTGRLWVVYNLYNTLYVCVSYSDDNGETWILDLTETDVGAGGPGSWYQAVTPSLAVDSNDIVHIVWHKYTAGYNHYLYHKKRSALGVWNAATLVWSHESALFGNGLYTSLAVDSSDNLHLTWCRYQSVNTWILAYCKRTGEEWNSDETADSIVIGIGISGISRPSLAVDSSNVPHILYTKGIGSNKKGIFHVDKSGGNWNAPTRVDSSVSYTTGGPCLAIDLLDNLHAVYRYSDGTVVQIWYRERISGVWQTEVQLTTGSTYDRYTPHIALCSDNSIQVVWYDYRYLDGSCYQVSHREYASGVWNIIDVIISEGIISTTIGAIMWARFPVSLLPEPKRYYFCYYLHLTPSTIDLHSMIGITSHGNSQAHIIG